MESTKKKTADNKLSRELLNSLIKTNERPFSKSEKHVLDELSDVVNHLSVALSNQKIDYGKITLSELREIDLFVIYAKKIRSLVDQLSK